MTRFFSFVDQLGACFGTSLAELTAAQRARVERDFPPGKWDGMKPEERRITAEKWDLMNRPMSATDLKRVETHFVDLDAAESELKYWRSRSDESASDAAIKQDRLRSISKQLADLEARHKSLRGDDLPTGIPDVPVAGSVAPNDWKSRIQIKASEHWKSLRASGANPTVHSIVPFIARWCRENGVKTSSHINPRERYIREHVLGGKHWTPPD